MKKTVKTACAATLVAILASGCDKNSEPQYGDSGFPSNCRALISAAIDDWNKSSGTPEEFAVMRGSLESIDRNCGKSGHLW